MEKCQSVPDIMNQWDVLVFIAIILSISNGIRITFSNCQNPEWTCINNIPNEIVFSCTFSRSHNYVLYLKDFFTDNVTSITVESCKDLKVVLDCPTLSRHSQLQRLKIRDCDKLEFISLSSNSLLQTPADLSIENVREIVSFPRAFFKSPNTNNEVKCLGGTHLKSLHVSDSKLNSIQTRAIYNVTGVNTIIFENVTIAEIQSQGIEALMGEGNTTFKMVNSNFNNVFYKAITVQSKTVIFAENDVGDLTSNAINITSENLYVKDNNFEEIRANALVFQAVNTEITGNTMVALKSYAFSNIKCSRKIVTAAAKHFVFTRNKLLSVEPHSFIFDYTGCKSVGTLMTFRENRIDCKCRNIAFLNSSSNELYRTILQISNNNTCVTAPCLLPLDIIETVLESSMCQIALDPQVMCLLYQDRYSSTNEVAIDEEVTEPSPTFYLIRQASSRDTNPSSMTNINKDEILRESHFNMTNRTTIKVVFDSSRGFVETLRSTSASNKRPVPASTQRSEILNNCDGSQCTTNNVARDRQKALDFYKYVYAQLRPPKPNENKKRT